LGTNGWLSYRHGTKGVAETTPMVVWGWFQPPLQEKKQREKQEIKKQTARFFYYIHQYHHYKNPKPKTLMVRRLLFPSGLCISLSSKLPHHAPLLQLNFNGWFQ
jgi:hypothetical protein